MHSVTANLSFEGISLSLSLDLLGVHSRLALGRLLLCLIRLAMLVKVGVGQDELAESRYWIFRSLFEHFLQVVINNLLKVVIVLLDLILRHLFTVLAGHIIIL